MQAFNSNTFCNNFEMLHFKRTMTYVSEKSRFTNINDPIWPRNFDIFANVSEIKIREKILLCHIVALIKTLIYKRVRRFCNFFFSIIVVPDCDKIFI